MRILHFSDLHIGIENYGRPASEEDLAALPEHFAPGEPREGYLGYSTRMIDFLCAFDELVHYALNEDVDLVLFSGDAYKNREPTQTQQREFAKRIARLSAGGVPVFLLVGNHDLPQASYKANAVEIFATLGIPNVTVGDRLSTYTVKTRGGPLQIIALPWVRRSNLLARDDIRNMPFDQVNDLMEERLTAGLQARAGALDPSIPAVISAHVTLNTARLGTERTMMVGYDHVLLQSNLSALPIDYAGLGHIHKPQKLAESPHLAYSGSLQRVDFGEEEHDDKGFWILDLDAGKPVGSRVRDLTFRPVQARSFVTIEAAIDPNDVNPTETVIRAIGRRKISDAIVRVIVKLPAALEPALRERDIKEALSSYKPHTIAGIARLVDRPQRTRLGGIHAEGKSPQEMLHIYLGTRETAPERARKLSSYAERLIQARETGEGK